MEQTPKQQTIELIRAAQRIIVLAHQNPDGDGVGSMLALTLALRKLGKEVQAVCSDPAPSTFRFLPAVDEIRDQIEAGGEFTINLDTKAAQVDKLGYKNYPDEHRLAIVIKSLQGIFTPEMVTFGAGGAKADLLIVLDTNDVERLGPVYERYTTLFYETPIINIDHHPGNDYFGKVNWVELTATSTAEILVALLEALSAGGPKTPGDQAKSAGKGDKGAATLLDPDIATLLLTGITTDTGSFQNTNTTPKSFTVAAQLVAAGARQQEIVQHIYKTKPLSTLKLWGKILSGIHEDRDHRFIYSSVQGSDFSTYGAAETETSGVIDELLKTVPNIDFALLLSEKRQGLYGSLRGVNKAVSVAEVAKLFGGGGHEMAAAFRIPGGSLADNEDDIIEKIRQFQAGRRTEVQPNGTAGTPAGNHLPSPPPGAISGQPVAGQGAPSAQVPSDSQPAVPSVASLKERQAALGSSQPTIPKAPSPAEPQPVSVQA